MADITVLAFPEVTSDDGDGIIYLIQGTGAARDKKIQVKNLIGNTLEVTATGSVDLSSYGADLVLFANSGAAITITFSNYLGAGKQIQIVGVGAGLVTLAGTITDVVFQNEVRKHVSSGTAFYNRDPAILKVDTIQERSSGKGTSVNGISTKKVSIGGWDCHTNATTTVAHGLIDHEKILYIGGLMVNDAGTLTSPMSIVDSAAIQNVGIFGTDSTNITLLRKLGGQFDQADYSSIASSRGELFITYEV